MRSKNVKFNDRIEYQSIYSSFTGSSMNSANDLNSLLAPVVSKSSIHPGSLTPLTSFLPLTDLNTNENFTSIVHKSADILFWPDPALKLIFSFDFNLKQILLYNYQTEKRVGRISIEVLDSKLQNEKVSFVKLVLVERTPDISGGNMVNVDTIGGYYFLYKDYCIYTIELFKNKKLLRINLKDLEPIFKRKYHEYLPSHFSKHLLTNFIPIPPAYYILILDSQLRISAINSNKTIQTLKFKNKINSHYLNIDSSRLIVPDSTNKIFIVLFFDNFEMQVYQLVELRLSLVFLVDSASMTSYGFNKEFNRGVKFRFDRNFLVNGDNRRSVDNTSQQQMIVRFLVSRKEVFYLFEAENDLNEYVSDPEGNQVTERFTYKVRRILLWEPVSLDFLDECVCMIRKMDHKLACFNLATKKTLKFNEETSSKSSRLSGIHIISQHTLLLYDPFHVSLIKLSQLQKNSLRLIATSRIDGFFFHRIHNYLFAETENSFIKKVNLSQLTYTNSQLNSNILKLESAFLSTDSTIYVLDKQLVFDFNDKQVFLIDLFTKETLNILTIGQESPYKTRESLSLKIQEIYFHRVNKALFVLITDSNQRHFLNIYKIHFKQETSTYVLETRLANLKIGLLNSVDQFFSSSQFQAINSSFTYFTYSKKPGNELKNRTCQMNTLNLELDKRTKTILILSLKYQLKFRPFKSRYLGLVGETVELVTPSLDKKIAKYNLKHKFGPQTQFFLLEGTDDFFLLDTGKVYFCRKMNDESLKFYICSVDCRKFLAKDKNACLLTNTNGRVIVMRMAWTDENVNSMDLESFFTGIKEVKEIWMSSDGKFLFCQDYMNILRVFGIESREEIATLPVYKQVKRLFTEDDLIVILLANGTLASFLLIDNFKNKNAEYLNKIQLIKQISSGTLNKEAKRINLEGYLEKLEESKTQVDQGLNKSASPTVDSLAQYDEDCFESFINKNNPSVLMEPVNQQETAPSSVCKHFEGKVFQAVPEDSVPVVKIKEETTKDDMKKTGMNGTRLNTEFFKNIETNLKNKTKFSFRSDTVVKDDDQKKSAERKRDRFKKLFRIFKRA